MMKEYIVQSVKPWVEILWIYVCLDVLWAAGYTVVIGYVLTLGFLQVLNWSGSEYY